MRHGPSLRYLFLAALLVGLAGCSINPIPSPQADTLGIGTEDQADTFAGAGQPDAVPPTADAGAQTADVPADVSLDAGETLDASTSACDGDEECDDGNPWTVDSCGANGCEHHADPADGFPCETDADCPSRGSMCPSRCEEADGACLPDQSMEVCGCASDADCDDGNPCTEDSCFSDILEALPVYCCGICERTGIPGCEG